ncbi:MAG: hypothetical protein COB17_03665 [Sulfurimonas sp.]|nr:MAG: hypothetical protein COB17_03665 [Sulfurimonas sp.]
MFKNILISGLLCTFLSAESFDTFLQKAITNSPYLKSNALALNQAKEQGSVVTRYSNPTLELEHSTISHDGGDDESGYRINYSQPIRLWNIADTRESLASNILNSANASYEQQKAIFIRDISLAFSLYAQQKMLLSLGDEELSIAKRIYDISMARYQSGTVSRGLMLQSKVDYETIKVSKASLELALNQSYYRLLGFAGINEEVQLDSEYTFNVISTSDNLTNPNIKFLQSKKEQSLSLAKLNSNKIEWINIYTEYEYDPEQYTYRFGANFPLAFFNTKAEEKKIAKLQASRSQLLIDNETKRLNIEVKRLQKESTSLKNLRLQNENILTTEIELLDMFKEGYKIANINLLQLQDVKNKVIFTKRSLIQIHTSLNQNAININYNQGSYND